VAVPCSSSPWRDEHGLVETVLFPDVYASLQDLVTTPGRFIEGGRVEDDNGEVQLRVSEVIPFYLRPRASVSISAGLR
jgi:hypothetical protein